VSRKLDKLHKKLFEVRQEARTVAKNGDAGEYEFARFEDVLAEASRLLDEKKISIERQVVSEDLRFSASGFAIATVVMEFEVIDISSGGQVVRRWSGTGEDKPGDKALYKAQTGCEKYFLAKLLRIPFGTDPETVESPQPVDPAGEVLYDSAEADEVRAAQDEAAEAPQVARHERPLPRSDHPPAAWENTEEREPVSV
jgi:hypothetical protein